MSDAPELGTWRFVFADDRMPLVVRDAREDESASGDYVIMLDAAGRIAAKVQRGTYLYMERVPDDEPERSSGFKPTSQVLEGMGVPPGAPPWPLT